MHNLLENYLSEVAAHLSTLPTKQRNEELREMRAHLENAVIVSRKPGQSEEETAQSVVAQFGIPKDLGVNVVWAWRRGKRQDWKSFFGAALASFLLLLMIALLFDHYEAFWSSHLAFILTRDLTNAALIGAFTGLLFPKRAVAGTAFIYGSLILWDVIEFFNCNDRNTPFPIGSYRSIEYVLTNLWDCDLFERVSLLLIAIFAAWGVSRWRRMAARRSRLAVGL